MTKQIPKLIPPYGGTLVQLLVPTEELEEVKAHAGYLPTLQLTQRSVCDLELLACGGFSPLARLTLRHLDPSSDDIAFDPVLHSDEDVRLVPGWLADLRRAAYRRSREGRDAG